MVVLSFGHIPTWAGGKQNSGLANVIYQLAKHGSSVDSVSVVLVATDSNIKYRRDGDLLILGWTKIGLIGYILVHPLRSIRGLLSLKRLKRMYPVVESTMGLFLKRVFLEKSLLFIKPEIVHLHGAQGIWYIDLVPATIKIVVTFHGMTGLDSNVPQHKILFKMERDLYLSSRVNECYFICTRLVSDFRGAYGDNGKKNQVIFNAYDRAKFFVERKYCGVNYTASNRVVICTIASLSELKGQIRVLKALSSLKDKRRFRYFCIGGGSEEYRLLLHEFADKNCIDYTYLGKMKPDDIRKYLLKADYMIMPSSSEGFGLTYLESIACGTPVILPRTIPIAEEKELINSNNSILLNDSSVESIINVLSNIDKYSFKREQVADTVGSLTWDEVAQQYFESFKMLE